MQPDSGPTALILYENTLRVRQVKEWGEILTGFEGRNRYEVVGQGGEPLYFAGEVGSGLGLFLLRNFFAGIPAELMEAARMDGAGDARIFLRVVLPLGFPALASLAIFQFLWTWNDLLVGLVFASPGNRPITVAIQQQTEEFGLNLDVIAPAAFLSMIVPLIVFLAFQRYFVQGLLAGSSR